MFYLFKCLSLTALLAAVVLAFTIAIVVVPLLLVVSYYCWRKGDLCAAAVRGDHGGRLR